MSAFITVMVTLCHIAGGQELCVEEIVTDNTMDDKITMMSCYDQASLVDWMTKHPLYHTWRVAKYGCTIGNKPPKDTKHDKA